MDFTTGWPFMPNILPLAIARGKIFGIKVVKSVYIQAPMNYFLNVQDYIYALQ